MRLILFLAALALAAPKPSPAQVAPAARELSSGERADLETALGEAGSSPLEYLRAIEKHLQKYPDSPRKPELERAAVRAAMEAGDDARIIRYGEPVLARDPNDLQILDRITRALLAGDSAQSAGRALEYARRFEERMRIIQRASAPSGISAAEWQEQVDRRLGAALRYQARAQADLGRPADALALARSSFETWPDAASAREISRCQERLGRPLEAARALADAFTVPDSRNNDADRARDRGRMGDLYREAKGSEDGLGDLVLEAYDRNLAVVRARELRMRRSDPNASLTDPMEFTLSSPDGGKLAIPSLKGKVLVFDFWATWCRPCRVQQPLYEKVKERFRDRPEVVFLSVNTDEDREAVKPFVEKEKWAGPVYFEDGLARALEITSIPTTVIIDRHGKAFSRMNGFVPERFVDMLAERIHEALAN
jgi:thiol-disulfide isomerase/thioredoxin